MQVFRSFEQIEFDGAKFKINTEQIKQYHQIFDFVNIHIITTNEPHPDIITIMTSTIANNSFKHYQ